MKRWYFRAFRWALRLGAVALVVAALASFLILSPVDAALVMLIIGLPALQYLFSRQTDTLLDGIAAPEPAEGPHSEAAEARGNGALPS